MKYITLEKLDSFATKLALKIETIFAKKTDIPKSLPANGGNAATVNGKKVESDVPASAKFTDTIYNPPDTGVTAGTYKSVTVDIKGRVTGGTNPSTLGGYGITDAASKAHTHGNADITSLDAAKLTGTVDIARLPQGALERCIVVADDTARMALLKSSVQTGDTVKVTSTEKMYFVVDDTKLNVEAGYEIYTAGSATSVPWSGISGKPTTFAPSTHSHSKSQITDFPASMPASDVSAWAKAASKPRYNPTEVGVIDATPANLQVAVFDGTTGKIKSTGYTIDSSVPSSAKFTDTIYTHLTTSGNKHIPSGGSAGQFLKWSADGTAIWAADNNTTYGSMTGATASVAGSTGLVPAPASGSNTKYLRGDGTWVDIPAAEEALDSDIDNIINGLFT